MNRFNGHRRLGSSLAVASLLFIVVGCEDEAAIPATVQPSSVLSELPGKADALEGALTGGAETPIDSPHAHTEGRHRRGRGEMMAPAVGRGMMGKRPAAMSPGKAKAKPTAPDASAKDAPKDMPRVHHVGASGFFLDLASDLALTGSQTRELNELKQDALVAMATTERQMDEAEQELWTLTGEAEPDVGKIHDKTKEVGRMTVKRRLGFIRAVGKASKVLTDEQRQTVAKMAGDATAGQDDVAAGEKGKMGDAEMGKMGDAKMGEMGDAKMAKMGKMADAKKAKMGKMGDAKMGKMADAKKAKMGKMADAKKAKMGKMGDAKMGKMGDAKKAKMGKMAKMGMAMMGKNPVSGSKMGQMSLPSSLPGFPGASHLYHVGATGFFLDHADSIVLTDEQRAKLEKMKSDANAALEAAEAKIDDAELELWTLTAAAELSDGDLEAKLEQIALLFVERRMAFIRSVGAAAEVLTDKQRDILVGQSPH